MQFLYGLSFFSYQVPSEKPEKEEKRKLEEDLEVKETPEGDVEVEVLVERGLAGPSGLVGQVLRTVCSRVRANLLSNYLSLAAFTIAFRIFQLCSGLIFSMKQSDSFLGA